MNLSTFKFSTWETTNIFPEGKLKINSFSLWCEKVQRLIIINPHFIISLIEHFLEKLNSSWGRDLFIAKCVLDITLLAELFRRLGALTLFSAEWKGAWGICHLRRPLRPGSCSQRQACAQLSSLCWLLLQASIFQFSVLSALSVNVPPNSQEVPRKFPSNLVGK